MGRIAVVVVGGGPLSPRAQQVWQQLVDAEVELEVIAADSGLDHAVAAGIDPHRLVGDLDSVSAAGRMWAYAHEVHIDEHPAIKDETDTELALAAAIADPQNTGVLLLGGLDPLVDGRLDHVLGTLLCSGTPRWPASNPFEQWWEAARSWCCTPAAAPTWGWTPANCSRCWRCTARVVE